MLRLLCLYSILNIQYSFYGTSPLIGKDVRMADLEEFPFVVSISRRTNEVLEKDELSHICGGSLITTTHVLTAAHCLLNKQLDSIIVKIGSIDLRKARNFGIQWWLTYTQWTGNYLAGGYNPDAIYDMAIIKLNDTVSDIELPTISYIPEKDLHYKSAVTCGWGRIEDNKRPRYMRIAKFIIKPLEQCTPLLSLTDLFLKELLPKLTLCAAALSTASLAPGDSGSPLLHDDNNIVGINSDYCIPMVNFVPLSHCRSLHSSVNAYAQFIEEVKRK